MTDPKLKPPRRRTMGVRGGLFCSIGEVESVVKDARLGEGMATAEEIAGGFMCNAGGDEHVDLAVSIACLAGDKESLSDKDDTRSEVGVELTDASRR